jgi:hypothetical protein
LPDGEVVHTVDVVTGTVVGGVYAVVGTTAETGGELGARVVVVRFDGDGVVGANEGFVALVVGTVVEAPPCDVERASPTPLDDACVLFLLSLGTRAP